MQANTKIQDIAHRYVEAVRVVSIKPVGRADVYNMEVAEHHNFSVNGGVIVHNCMDDIRYLVNTVLDVPKAIGRGAKPTGW